MSKLGYKKEKDEELQGQHRLLTRDVRNLQEKLDTLEARSVFLLFFVCRNVKILVTYILQASLHFNLNKCQNLSQYIKSFNTFIANVTNKRLLGRPPKSLFDTKSHKNEHLFSYQNCFINLGCL
jgi:hypothetical protein